MKKLRIIAVAVLALLGLFTTTEGYKMSRPDYYLTISGSSPDDYTVAGYVLLVVGILMVIFTTYYSFVLLSNDTHKNK